ncbi:MAG: Trm112 family protein [Myxococcaceae bacterium]|nr:Trm112 family protein [Myxococcaceae bacterium]
MALDPTLLDILACPEDKGPLLYFAADGFLYNPRLKRKYRIDDGVPVMLIDEAQKLSDAEHDAVMKRAATEGVRLNFT